MPLMIGIAAAAGVLLAGGSGGCGAGADDIARAVVRML
jgi:hypothetical protein